MKSGESWDNVWDSVFKNQEWGKYPSEDLIRFIARNFYSSKNRQVVKILEIGCGPGANLWFAAREGFSVYGIDGSETAISHAKTRLDKEVPGWRGELKVGEIKDLPFESEFFDAVIDSEAICCSSYATTKLISTEVYRVLKSSGKFFSKTFAPGTWENGGLSGKGYTRFTAESEIVDLYDPLIVEEIDLVERTIEGIRSGKSIKEWLISASKT